MNDKEKNRIEAEIADLVEQKVKLFKQVCTLRANEPEGPERNIKELELNIKFQKLTIKIEKLFDKLGTPKLETSTHQVPFNLAALSPSIN